MILNVVVEDQVYPVTVPDAIVAEGEEFGLLTAIKEIEANTVMPFGTNQTATPLEQEIKKDSPWHRLFSFFFDPVSSCRWNAS